MEECIKKLKLIATIKEGEKLFIDKINNEAIIDNSTSYIYPINNIIRGYYKQSSIITMDYLEKLYDEIIEIYNKEKEEKGENEIKIKIIEDVIIFSLYGLTNLLMTYENYYDKKYEDIIERLNMIIRKIIGLTIVKTDEFII